MGKSDDQNWLPLPDTSTSCRQSTQQIYTLIQSNLHITKQVYKAVFYISRRYEIVHYVNETYIFFWRIKQNMSKARFISYLTQILNFLGLTRCMNVQLLSSYSNVFIPKIRFTNILLLLKSIEHRHVRLPTRRNDKCFIQYQQNAKQPSFYL